MVPELQSWSSPSGKVIAIGDVAQAMPPPGGQGAAMAFIYAEKVAYAISKPGNNASSPQKLESHRQVRVQQVINFNNLSAKLREASTYTIIQWLSEWFIWGVVKAKRPEGYRWLHGYDGGVEMARL
jgi:2-polyprenyl-6-methoxyphenol hydroxylase-like FAD-dependent oxidoreductase